MINQTMSRKRSGVKEMDLGLKRIETVCYLFFYFCSPDAFLLAFYTVRRIDHVQNRLFIQSYNR
jgi:hypothetical protein